MLVGYAAGCYFTLVRHVPVYGVRIIKYQVVHGRVPHVSYHCGNEKLSERYVYLDALDIFSPR